MVKTYSTLIFIGATNRSRFIKKEMPNYVTVSDKNKLNLHCNSTIHCRKCWKISKCQFLALKIYFAIHPDNSNCFPSEFESPGFYCTSVQPFFSLSPLLSSPTFWKTVSCVKISKTCCVWELYRLAKFVKTLRAHKPHDWRTCWRKLSKLTNYKVYQKPVYRKQVWNNSYRLQFSVYPQAPAIISLFRALSFD